MLAVVVVVRIIMVLIYPLVPVVSVAVVEALVNFHPVQYLLLLLVT